MEWRVEKELIGYEEAVSFMEKRVADIHAVREDELIWILEHPSLYTAGSSAKEEDLLDPRFPVFNTGRGGQYTYHGPGQLVCYVMLNLRKRSQEPDIRQYICDIENWIIRTLSVFGIEGSRKEERVGIWVDTTQGEKKIAAIGVRVRHWITYHGFSINIEPDLSHFDGIVPCGLAAYGVTSFDDLGRTVLKRDVVKALRDSCVFA